MILTETRRVASNPSARLLAHRHGIDVRSIQGSGPNGRIVKHDVVLAVAARVAGRREARSQRLAAPRIIATDCRVDRLVSLRDELNANRSDRFSIDDLVLRAAALAQQEMPVFNADGAIGPESSGRVATGLVVSTGVSLFGCAVHEAGDSLVGIRLRSRAIQESARTGRFNDDGLSPVLCVGNISLHGMQALAELVGPHCVALLAFGPVQTPVGDDGQTGLARNRSMRCVLMTDPGRVTAETASAWLSRFQRLLESPVALLV